MKQGDVICENGMRLLVVSSYDHKEPCRDRDSARPKGCHIMYIWFIIKR